MTIHFCPSLGFESFPQTLECCSMRPPVYFLSCPQEARFPAPCCVFHLFLCLYIPFGLFGAFTSMSSYFQFIP